MARWLRCFHCRLTARRSWVQCPHGVLLALGGRSSPDLQCSGGLSPGPFCVEFACSPRVHKGFPPLRTPTEKTCKRTEHSSSVPDQDRRLKSLGPRALKSCPLLLESWRKDSPGWEKAEAKFTATSGLRVRVCVSCVASMYSRVLQCAVCRLCD